VDYRRTVGEDPAANERHGFTPGGDPMTSYVMTTGAVFGLITLAHLLRVIEEGPRLVADPWFVVLTVAAATLCLWAARLLWPATRA
jgi:hypothetical protein